MKRMPRIICLIGVVVMLSAYGCSDGVKYEKYSSKDPEINITMDYVSGWLYSESRGSHDSYAQVIFYEPVRSDKNFKAGMIVTVEDRSKIAAGTSGAGSYAEGILAKRQKLKDMRLLSKSSGKLLGTSAISVEMTYRTVDRMNSPDARLIPVKEKIVFLERGDKFYTLRYVNTDAEYARYGAAFDHSIRSIKFKDKQ